MNIEYFEYIVYRAKKGMYFQTLTIKYKSTVVHLEKQNKTVYSLSQTYKLSPNE
jgi:hypothetical protein